MWYHGPLDGILRYRDRLGIPAQELDRRRVTAAKMEILSLPG